MNEHAPQKTCEFFLFFSFYDLLSISTAFITSATLLHSHVADLADRYFPLFSQFKNPGFKAWQWKVLAVEDSCPAPAQKIVLLGKKLRKASPFSFFAFLSSSHLCC